MRAAAIEHQIATGVLASTHQVAGRLRGKVGDPHGDELIGAQQAGQLEGVAAVGLDALTGGARNGDGAATKQPMPACSSARASR